MVEASIECVKPKRFWYVLVQYVLCKGSTSLSSRKLRQSVPPQNDHSMCLMCISAVMGPFATNNCATEKELLVILGERPRQNSYTDIACFTWNLVCVYVYYTMYIPTTFHINIRGRQTIWARGAGGGAQCHGPGTPYKVVFHFRDIDEIPIFVHL